MDMEISVLFFNVVYEQITTLVVPHMLIRVSERGVKYK